MTVFDVEVQLGIHYSEGKIIAFRKRVFKVIGRKVEPSALWTYRESNSRLSYAKAPVYHLPIGPFGKVTQRRVKRMNCGPKGTRTPDLLYAIQTRYQLRHGPTVALNNVRDRYYTIHLIDGNIFPARPTKCLELMPVCDLSTR